MMGLIVIITSFVVASIMRRVLMKKEECIKAKFVPQLIMLAGGLIGAFLFLQDNWSRVG